MENEREYTFGVPPQQISEEIEREYDEVSRGLTTGVTIQSGLSRYVPIVTR